MSSEAAAHQTTADNTDGLIEKIRDARKRRMDWVELADTIDEIEKDPDWKPVHGSKEDFWKTLTDVTGYDRNTLQRMKSVLRNLRRLQKDEAPKLKKIFSDRYSEGDLLPRVIENVQKGEFVIRIHRADPDVAIQLIERMATGKVPVNTVREIWREVLNAHPEQRLPSFTSPGVMRAPKKDRDACLAELEEQKSLLYGGDEVSIYFRRYKFDFVSADAVGICYGEDGGLKFVDGFIVFDQLKPMSPTALEDCMARIDYKSRFFRHLWIFTTFELNLITGKMSNAIDKLGIERVGIVTYEKDQGVKVYRRPVGNGKPSRYPMIVQDIMRQGIPDFGIV